MSSVFRIAAICFSSIGILIAVAALIGEQVGVVNFRNFILSGLVIYVSASLYFVFHRRGWSMNRVESCVLLVFLWVVIPVPVTVALMQATEISLIDAYFEATSALTTTGATVFPTLADVPTSIIFLRGAMQWVGGLLTLSGVVLVLAPMGLGGLPTPSATIINTGQGVARSGATQIALGLLASYSFLTVFCFLLLILTQVSAFDAFMISLSTVSSGGFVPTDVPITNLGNALTTPVLIFFMILAGTSIIWQRLMTAYRVQRLKAHRETYYYFVAVGVLGLVYTLTFFERAGSADVLTPLDAVREGFFTAASLLSTTGFEIRNSSFSVLPATIVLMIVVVGGCSFSTAGGISFYRVGGMITHSLKDLKILVYPSSVLASKFGSQRYDVQMIKAIWTYFFAVITVTSLGTALLALRLDSFEAALIASIAAFSNMGPFYATGWSETRLWMPFSEMDAFSKSVFCGLMILGRLHILAVLTAVNRTYWLDSR